MSFFNSLPVLVNFNELANDVLQMIGPELGYTLTLHESIKDIDKARVRVTAKTEDDRLMHILTTFVIVFDGEQWTAFADRKASCSIIDDLDNQHGWAASDLAPARSLPLMI